MLLTTVSPSQFPWWNENKLHSFTASCREPGAALHKLPLLSAAVKEDAMKIIPLNSKSKTQQLSLFMQAMRLYKATGLVIAT